MTANIDFGASARRIFDADSKIVYGYGWQDGSSSLRQQLEALAEKLDKIAKQEHDLTRALAKQIAAELRVLLGEKCSPLYRMLEP